MWPSTRAAVARRPLPVASLVTSECGLLLAAMACLSLEVCASTTRTISARDASSDGHAAPPAAPPAPPEAAASFFSSMSRWKPSTAIFVSNGIVRGGVPPSAVDIPQSANWTEEPPPASTWTCSAPSNALAKSSRAASHSQRASSIPSTTLNSTLRPSFVPMPNRSACAKPSTAPCFPVAISFRTPPVAPMKTVSPSRRPSAHRAFSSASTNSSCLDSSSITSWSFTLVLFMTSFSLVHSGSGSAIVNLKTTEWLEPPSKMNVEPRLEDSGCGCATTEPCGSACGGPPRS